MTRKKEKFEPFSEVDLKAAQSFIVDLIYEGGKIARDSQSETHRVSSKDSFEIVTQTDIRLHEFFTQELTRRFPQTTVISEEDAPDNYSKLEDLENVWIVDPIDGTQNYARGASNFALSIGLVDRGKTKLGAVYLPTFDELYLASVDCDHATLNGAALSVSPTLSLSEAIVAYDWSYSSIKRKEQIDYLEKIYPPRQAIENAWMCLSRYCTSC